MNAATVNTAASTSAPSLRRRGVVTAVLASGPLGLTGAAGLMGLLPMAARAADPSKRYDSGAFRALRSSVGADFKLAPAAAPGVEVQAEAKVLALVRVVVQGGVLVIDTSAGYVTQRPITVKVGFTALERLELGGTATASLSGVKGSSLELRLAGNAELNAQGLELQAMQAEVGDSATARLVGRAGKASFEAAGSADLLAAGLSTAQATVVAGGSSTTEVSASDTLDVKVGDAATVRYKGRPKLRETVSGAGTLEPLAG